MTASAGCRRSRFCRGLHQPERLSSQCLLDGEAYDRALLGRIAEHSQLEALEPSTVLAELQGRLADWRSLLRGNARRRAAC